MQGEAANLTRAPQQCSNLFQHAPCPPPGSPSAAFTEAASAPSRQKGAASDLAFVLSA